MAVAVADQEPAAEALQAGCTSPVAAVAVAAGLAGAAAAAAAGLEGSDHSQLETAAQPEISKCENC